ncbi:putative uncharacterized protein [Clostridium sp. CAG:413]|nr:putative uncharacterized protein [Clostridium sp. CAG:413]
MEKSDEKTYSRYRPARRALLFWTIFIGIGAVAGSSAMLIDPSGGLMGMDAMLPYFQKLPFAEIVFQDFVFSGISLLIVNGISNLTAAGLLIANKRIGAVLGGVFGITLMLWICIQFYMFPLNFMSTAYFIFGFIQAITGYMTVVFYDQEHFTVNESDYPNIGSDPTKLVVYFSRMGYTKKKALEAADRTGAEIYEVRAAERTSGTLDFWWCGRYGMHRWAMPIEDIGVQLEKYDHVTVCSPVWVFNLCAPMREFCKKASGRIRSADYILVHHQKSLYANAADEMDRLLGLADTPAVSVCCREGRYLKQVRIR